MPRTTSALHKGSARKMRVRHLKRVAVLGRLISAVACFMACAAVAFAAEEHRTGIEHWAFKPPTNPDVPSVGDSSHVRNPTDAFIVTRLTAEKLAPSAEAD